MNRLILSSRDFQKMPYASTNVSWTKTKGDCEGILFARAHEWRIKKETED